MTRAGLYLRKSTDEQYASLEVQREEAIRKIERQGWILDPSNVFEDAGVSRAEFKKRKGLVRMLQAAEERRFDVLVVRDESRLGGDQNRTSLLLRDLYDDGIKTFYYYSEEWVKLDSSVDTMMMNLRSFVAEIEREKISERTHEHLLTKARKGFVVGGRVYGYNLHEVKEGDRRLHVEYRVNAEQAEIVREIFTRYAQGEGLRKIAQALNARGIPSPRAGKRTTKSWSITTLQPMLRREMYRGTLIWNRREKTYKKGTKVRILRDPCEWIHVPAEHLRILPEGLWLEVASRIHAAKHGQRKGGRPAQHLLSGGILQCGQCNGNLGVRDSRSNAEKIKVYSCTNHKNRGDAVCKEALRRPIEAINGAVIEWVKRNILTEDLISETLKELRLRLKERDKSADKSRQDLEREACRLRAEIDRLVAAVKTTNDPPAPLVHAISESQVRLARVESDLRVSRATPAAIEFEIRRMEREALSRLQDLRGLLQGAGENGRKIMASIFTTPITAHRVETPTGPRFALRGTATLAEMIVGESFSRSTDVISVPNEASPGGFEPPLAT